MSLALRSARAVRADTRLRRVRVRSRRQWAQPLRAGASAQKRCHDTKLFGGYGRLVGLVLLCGRRDRLDKRVCCGLGFRLLGVHRIDLCEHIVLALLIDQKRLTRLCGDAPNVSQLTQIDIDLDGLVRGIPRKPCHDLVIDDLGQIFGDLLLLLGGWAGSSARRRRWSQARIISPSLLLFCLLPWIRMHSQKPFWQR